MLVSSCGGGGGGERIGDKGLVLINFYEADIGNVALNQVLQFEFSTGLDPATVSSTTIQIRKGSEFGTPSNGEFEVLGSTVLFRPHLPGRCDLADGGFQGGTEYRVTLVGGPEEFCLRNADGQPLNETSTWQFATRPDNDPGRFVDQIPTSQPLVMESTPAPGDAAVAAGLVDSPQRVVFTLTENLDPCSVGPESVSIQIFEVGGTLEESIANPVNGRRSGFVTGGNDVTDQTPSDFFSWGSDTGSPWPGGPQTLPATVHLVQDYDRTQIVVSPRANQDPKDPVRGGTFPDNVLIVVQLKSRILDFSGLPLTPYTLAFTTENTEGTQGQYVMDMNGETPFDPNGTTADVNTARAPGRVQGYLVFAGDGDNGTDITKPSLPGSADTNCEYPLQANDGTKDDFDASQDVVLDTGATLNSCSNSVDGSTAVVWEFQRFTIRGGATVRLIGVNPAILLVQQEAVIESGGRLLARGDGSGGAPRGSGNTGYTWTSYATAITKGGKGVAGGGAGGDAAQFEASSHGGDGYSGYGSPDGYGIEGGEGAGLGGSNHDTTYPSSPGTAQGGGGGGHAEEGGTSTNILGTGHTNQGTTRGDGGAPYVDSLAGAKLALPSAGSGGGAGGNEEWDQSYDGIYSTGGGSGGAGGGFIGIACAGDIIIQGTIDAAGSAGGPGGSSSYYAGPGGGGGGAGGGIRLLTPMEIKLGPLAVITAAGGAGGNSPNGSSGTSGPQNHGAPGAVGRIVFEDGDSVISGMQEATVIPGEGQEGFYRGPFDPSRFQGGGVTPEALTELIWMGPLAPIYQDPVPADFVLGAPAGNTQGPGSIVIEIEAQGFPVRPDGTANLDAATGFQTVGWYTDSGIPTAPYWQKISGLAWLSGYEFLQFRFKFHLSNTAGPLDPGPFIDRWVIHVGSDN